MIMLLDLGKRHTEKGLGKWGVAQAAASQESCAKRTSVPGEDMTSD